MANFEEKEQEIVNVEAETATTENMTIEEKVEVMDAETKKHAVLPAKSKKRKGANKIKGTAGELKHVTWPSFGTVVKNTAVVLSVVAVFLLVVIGIDQLLYLLYNLLTKNM